VPLYKRPRPRTVPPTVGVEHRPHARLKVVNRIARCAATNVDHLTGIRDLNIPKTLVRALGLGSWGIYADVTAAGKIAAGDEIEIV